MNINSHILKITGSAELEKELEFNKEYKIAILADVNKTSNVNRDDGTMDTVYYAKLLTANIIGDKEIIKCKDKRKKSQKHRNAIRIVWLQECPEVDFDEFYEKFVSLENANIFEIYNYFIKTKL